MPPNEDIIRARAALGENDAAEAVRILRGLLQRKPENAGARGVLAQAYEAQGELGAAAAEHGKALSASPEDLELCQAAFSFYAGNGMLGEGLGAFGGVVQAHPEWPIQRTMYANLLNGLGRVREARREFGAVAQLAEGDLSGMSPTERLHIGSACVLAGRGELGAGVLEPLVEESPDAPHYHLWLARALALTGQDDRAFAHFRTAARLDPNSDAAAIACADFCLAARAEEAEWAVDELLSLRPDLIDYRIGLIKQLQERGDFSPLRRQWGRLALRAKGDGWEGLTPEQRLFVGAACVETDEGELAVPVLEDLVAETPGIWAHQEWLARAYSLVGRDEEAIEILAGAFAGDPENCALGHKLALAQQKGGDVAGAEATLRGLLGIDACAIATRALLADILVGVGRAAEADTLLTANADVDDRTWATLSPDEQMQVAAGNLRLGRFERAIELLERVCAQEPDRPDAQVWLARAHRQNGDYEAALRVLDDVGEGVPADRGMAMEKAESLWSLGRPAEAVDVLEDHLMVDGEVIELRCRLYHWLSVLQRDAQLLGHQEVLAERARQEGWGRLPADQLLFIGASCVSVGRGDDAVAVLQELVGMRGDIAAHHLWLAKAWRLEDRPDRTAEAVLAALSIQPVTAGVVLECAQVLQLTGAPRVHLDHLVALPVDTHDASVEQAVELLCGQCHHRLGALDEAVTSLTAAGVGEADAVRMVAFEALAEIHAARGDAEAAREARAQATEVYPTVEEAVRRDEGGRYTANRWQVDKAVQFKRQELRLEALAAEQRGDADEAIAVYERLYRIYPKYPGARGIALKLAGLLLRAGECEAAFAYCLAVLETGTDRCFGTHAELAENQSHLDEVARPAPLQTVMDAVRIANECLRDEGGGTALSEEGVVSFGRQWHRALRQTFSASGEEARAAWAGPVEEAGSEPWRTLCALARAETLMRDGMYRAAMAVLEQQPGDLPRAVQHRLASSRCAAYAALDGPDQAAAHLADVLDGAPGAQGHGPMLKFAARRALAEANERARRFEEAADDYDVIVEQSPSLAMRQWALDALERVAAFERLPVGAGTLVVPLSDDRTTRGYWPKGYGSACHVLCAQNFIVDVVGGAGPLLDYRLATTDPGEPGRLWVSRREDNDPAAVWNPMIRARRPANWDDHGEQVPIGQGPDLLISADVPEGGYVLSLYFANDHSFYEPSRQYAVSVTDAAGELQAVTHVRDFGGGVYKRFAVVGPRALTFRIHRGLSLNTVVSGVFLDHLTPPRPQPHSVEPARAEEASTLRGEYDAIAAAASQDALSAMGDGCRRVRELAEELEGVIARPADADPGQPQGHPITHAAEYWMLSECSRLLGRPSDSERSFDQYVGALRAQARGSSPVEFYGALARAIAGEPGSEAFVRQVHRRRVLRPGDHRLDRVWDSCLNALADEEDTGVRSEALSALVTEHAQHVTPYVKLKAFERLNDVSTRAAQTPGVLLAAGRAAREAGDAERSMVLLEDALAAGPSEGQRASVLFGLLLAQAKAGSETEELEATYTELAQYASDPRRVSLVRTGLYYVAGAYCRDGDHVAALQLLEQYKEAYGEDEQVEDLIGECHRVLGTTM